MEFKRREPLLKPKGTGARVLKSRLPVSVPERIRTTLERNRGAAGGRVRVAATQSPYKLSRFMIITVGSLFSYGAGFSRQNRRIV